MEGLGVRALALVSLCLALVIGPSAARACPRVDCAGQQSGASEADKQHAAEAPAATHVKRPNELRTDLPTDVASEGDDEAKREMPWIWRQLRRTAYRHLPRKRIDRFDATFAPTVVRSGFDTVAGAGVAGRF